MPFFQKHKKEGYEVNLNQANNNNTAATNNNNTNINNNSIIVLKDDKKQANVNNNRPNEQQIESNANASKQLKPTPSTNKSKPNIFTIFAKPNNELESIKKDLNNNNNKKPNEPVSNSTSTNNANFSNNLSAFKPLHKKSPTNPSLMSLIIDSSILNTESNNGNSSPDIFDPEPAPEDLSQLNQILV